MPSLLKRPMSEAFEYIPSRGHQELFIFGDHASRHIPSEYNNLGLSGDDLTRHIAWDIGTETIIRNLCAHFGCGGQLAGVSRLVIDLNRGLSADGLIPATSDGTVIAANQNLTYAQHRARIDRFYFPYHLALNERFTHLNDPLVLSVHSFTPQPREGARRLTDIGLLVKHDFETAELFQAGFETYPHYKVEINKPYSAYDLNHTIDVHVGPRGLRHLAIEIRQDLVDTPEGCETITQVLIDKLAPIINRAHICTA